MTTGTSSTLVHYSAEKATSQFVIQAFASGLISAVAHSPKIAIREWTGDILYDPKSPSNASLRVRINPASLDVQDEMRDSDRRELYRVMHQEVLEIPSYPEILFESSSVRVDSQSETQIRCDVAGNLTIHGVTNPHRFSAQAVFGVDSVRAYGDFKIRQTDFNIKIASIAGGAIKLQDELKCTYYVLARRMAVQKSETA